MIKIGLLSDFGNFLLTIAIMQQPNLRTFMIMTFYTMAYTPLQQNFCKKNSYRYVLPQSVTLCYVDGIAWLMAYGRQHSFHNSIQLVIVVTRISKN